MICPTVVGNFAQQITDKMKSKLFNNLLLFSLFGVALGSFGMLYEGVVSIPKMLDTSMARMLFWKNYYSIINPLLYYIPLVPLATITLIALYFKTPKEKTDLKNRLKLAGIFQVASLILTFYIVTQINPKLLFSNIEKYADIIPARILVVNILSFFRMVLTAIALTSIFKAYIYTQKDQDQQGQVYSQ
jgi:hypothetical protein